jgi:hypothetical protein
MISSAARTVVEERCRWLLDQFRSDVRGLISFDGKARPMLATGLRQVISELEADHAAVLKRQAAP